MKTMFLFIQDSNRISRSSRNDGEFQTELSKRTRKFLHSRSILQDEVVPFSKTSTTNVLSYSEEMDENVYEGPFPLFITRSQEIFPQNEDSRTYAEVLKGSYINNFI